MFVSLVFLNDVEERKYTGELQIRCSEIRRVAIEVEFSSVFYADSLASLFFEF